MKITIEIGKLPPGGSHLPLAYREQSDAERIKCILNFAGCRSREEFFADVMVDELINYEADMIFSAEGELIGDNLPIRSLMIEAEILSQKMEGGFEQY